MTSLRTKEGLSNAYLESTFNYDLLQDNYEAISQWEKDALCMINASQTIQLTLKGLLMADKLSSDLFIVS
jgi:coproporphyrinogen III oxidase-like Fe-S oxidoreductase